MPQLTEAFLRKRSSELLVEKTADVTIFDAQKEKQFPLFETKEVKFGNILGKGGFCTVYNVNDVRLNNDQGDQQQNGKSADDFNENEFFTITQDRRYIHENFIRVSDGKHRYAIKKLSRGLFDMGDPQHFVCGVIDLAMEVKFLSVLRHPHIIKMRAMADVHHCSDDFFILLDHLDMTLSKKVATWKKNLPSGFGSGVRKKKEEQFCERLMVGYDLCSGVAHMHNNKIIYRDVKPDNIGFDVRDDVKIFDFGLATEMTAGRRVEGTNTYALTKDTGSPRYMAPEVFKGIPYNEKCDTYSLGVILWQCLELAVPFEKMNIKQMTKDVYRGKVTPKMNSKWSPRIKDLLNNLFLRDFSKRYSCEQIMEILRQEIGEMDGDLMGELDVSNRTEASIAANVKKLRL